VFPVDEISGLVGRCLCFAHGALTSSSNTSIGSDHEPTSVVVACMRKRTRNLSPFLVWERKGPQILRYGLSSGDYYGKSTKKAGRLFFTITPKDIYFAEKKILVTLPKMAKAAPPPTRR
jgi:hypothetical protein